MQAVASVSLSSDRAGAAPGDALSAWLSGELRERLERATATAGISVSEACAQWVREGLERLEAQQAAAEAAGRCSLRTGTCTIGPVPLPVQQ